MDIRPIKNSDLVVNEGVKEQTKGYTTIALYGVDSRDSNLNTGTNSDAIILLSINKDTKEVKMVSVYRDTLLQIQSDSQTTRISARGCFNVDQYVKCKSGSCYIGLYYR